LADFPVFSRPGALDYFCPGAPRSTAFILGKSISVLFSDLLGHICRDNNFLLIKEMYRKPLSELLRLGKGVLGENDIVLGDFWGAVRGSIIKSAKMPKLCG
jgi:hypothetical protein